MIVDTSAIVAIVFREPGFETLLKKLSESTATAIGAPTLLEAAIVLSARLERDARSMLAEVIAEFHMVEVPFGEVHWREAVRAHLRFGRGRHPANLNYGDCVTYAVASLAAEPLLFAGEDFAATDLIAA